MNKLPCEVVQDLLPSYIDELTSEVTKNLVEEHVTECEDCQKVLSSMQNPEVEPVDEKNKAEIDFLRKTRKKNRKNIWMVAVALAVFFSIVIVRSCFIGTAIPSEYIVCQVEVNGDVLSINGAIIDERFRLSDVVFAEENGVITISFKSVQRNPFYNRSVEETYSANQEITEVHLGERILWARGENISAVASAVYQTRHAYIGDMPANGKTASALNMSMTLGSYTCELQTNTEPYGWIFKLEEEVFTPSRRFKEEHMQRYAYVLLAVIENLSEVTYEYMYNGEPEKMIITEEMASSFAGEDIKNVGKDIIKLQHMMEELELLDRAYVFNYSQWNSREAINIEIVNLAENDIVECSINGYIDRDSVFTQAMTYADGSQIKKGTVISFELLPEDFSDERWKKEKSIVLGFTITETDGKTYECEEQITLPKEFGYMYRYRLSGDNESGYYITQQ